MDAAQQEIASLERLVGPQGTSPLFARLADLYLQAGRPKDALRVCDAGLAHYPFYTTGHLVKGRTLVALEMTNEARRELEFVRDWLPTNPTVWAYLDSLPVDADQTLTLEPEVPYESATTTPEPDAFTPAPEASSADQNFFSAITDASPPAAAVDTSEPASAPAETNVFGLPSDAPADFGGFGGFGGGVAEETPAAEPESPMAAFGGFGGSAEVAPAGSPDEFAAASEVPAATYEETVTSALGGGAPGFVPAEPGETFESYADRLRLELGPTGIITLDQFLDGEGIVPTEAFGADAPSDVAVVTVAPAPSFDMPAAEASFDMPSTPAVEASAPATGSPAAADGFDFGGFPSFPTPAETTPTASEAPPSGGLDLSGFPSAEEGAAPTPAPSDDTGGFSGPAFDGPPPAADTSIEGLTAKLQSAKKITPVIDFSSRTSSDDDSSTMAGSSFVTPTLAEIYAKQGWFDDAIKAYRTLAKSKPAEREKYEERIKQLEEEKKKQGG